MDYKIEYTDKSKESINNIYYYIKLVLVNEIAAKNTIEGFFKAINNLALFPRKHRMSKRIFSKDYEIREAICNNYIIIYEIHDSIKTILIIDVVHSKTQVN